MFLSIMGMYEYDPSVFDGLELPTYTDKDNNIHIINKEALINNILLNCAELEVIYPDISTMKLAIGVWSAAEFRTWEKLYATTMVAYNPIWNVDADIIDTVTGTENRDINRETGGSNNRTLDITDTETVDLADNETVDLTDTESVKGFNSNTWAESRKNNKAGTDNISHTGTDTTVRRGTDNVDISASENVGDNVAREETRTQRRTGNIGVVSTQSMIEQERNIAEFSIINYITQAFKARFCLMIY